MEVLWHLWTKSRLATLRVVYALSVSVASKSALLYIRAASCEFRVSYLLSSDHVLMLRRGAVLGNVGLSVILES